MHNARESEQGSIGIVSFNGRRGHQVGKGWVNSVKRGKGSVRERNRQGTGNWEGGQD